MLVTLATLGVGARFVGTDEATPTYTDLATLAAAPTSGPATLPIEVRGVHVTEGLASLPGKLDEYFDLQRDGLTALELDVKDENGEVGFVSSGVPLASAVGAAHDYYASRDVAREAHQRGIYLIGRIVDVRGPAALERPPRARDPPCGRVRVARRGRPGLDEPVRPARLEVQRRHRRGRGPCGLRRDHVRLPPLPLGRVDRRRRLPKSRLVAEARGRPGVPALREAAPRSYGVRVSAAVFGLSATRDLGIGQLPRRMAPYLDTVYAMTYPSLFGPGELGLADPGSTPGATVSRALRRFQLALRGSNALLVPWVQDWTFSVPYGIDQVRAQIDAARISGAKGYMLWNAEGLYTNGALASR